MIVSIVVIVMAVLNAKMNANIAETVMIAVSANIVMIVTDVVDVKIVRIVNTVTNNVTNSTWYTMNNIPKRIMKKSWKLKKKSRNDFLRLYKN